MIKFKRNYTIQIDTCFRLMKCRSFREELLEMVKKGGITKAQLSDNYAGESVTLKYGTRLKNYRI